MPDDLLAAYLEALPERDFQRLLVALLRADGYSEIHLTHGPAEFGRDLIARSDEGQIGIQAKVGDVTGPTFREVRGQIDEMLTVKRVHPGQRSDISTAVLALTGRLVGTAPVAAEGYRQDLRDRYGAGFEVWDQDWVLSRLLGKGTTSLISLEPGFLELSSALAADRVEARHIDALFPSPGAVSQRQLWQWTAEAALLSPRLEQAGRLDLSARLALRLLRAAWESHLRNPRLTVDRIVALSRSLFVDAAQTVWAQRTPDWLDPRAFSRITSRGVGYATYPAMSLRIAELLGLLSMAIGSTADGREVAIFLSRFVQSQPGTSHPLSERWAQSLLAPTLVLAETHPGAAAVLIERAVKWVADRYERRALGLAPIGASPRDEVVAYLGSALILSESVTKTPESHSAYVLMLLARELGLRSLYETARNEFSAVGLMPIVQGPLSGEDLTSAVPPLARRGLAGWPEFEQASRLGPAAVEADGLGIPAWDWLAMASIVEDRLSPVALMAARVPEPELDAAIR